MEFPDEDEVLAALDEAVRANPGVDILVMSEYTFAGPVPERVRQWCKARRKYLIAGGKDPISGTDDFYNTAFVIGPEGEVAFKQAKSVPIQFFKDGLPAQEQRLWQSPRGAIGLCICYDLSYTRVTDRLVRMGARALIVPTMDMENWGAAQHWLHSRIASVRAAEYRLPVFRVCSSGVSQAVSERGQVHAFASVGAHGATISDMLELRMAEGGHVPWDRRLAPLCVAVAALVGLWLAVERSLGWSRRRRSR
jgi:apolipoprotein N-acyltransferase